MDIFNKSIKSIKEKVVLTPKKLFPINDLTDTEIYGTNKKCCKRISYEEHAYTKNSTSVDQIESDLEIKLDAEKGVLGLDIPDWLSNVDSQLQAISNKDSVLFHNKPCNISDINLFNRAIVEFKRVCPSLFDILLLAFSRIENSLSKIATLATIYGMILHSRNNRISAIQRLYSTVVLAHSADNRLLTKLNTVHLTLTEHSKRALITSYGQESEEQLLQSISSGKNGKFNGDNLDIRVQTNDIRMTSTEKDKDYHFFASDFVFDRLNLQQKDRTSPNIDDINLTVHNFIPTTDEYKHFKECLKVLLARQLKRYPGFDWMTSIVPDHIHHEYSEDMAKKSELYILPISLNNEAKYQDCIHIMEEYERLINRWYTQTGRGGELDYLHVPVGGDQLTRVRLQGAKSLRAGAHTKSERFDHLQPIIIELFHTVQDFLEKLCRKFLDFKQSREPGTLANLKILIERVNVNGNVKSRFKAHEDFILTSGTSYFHTYILTKFGMNSMEDFPKHQSIKETIRSWRNEHKQKVFNKVMDEIIADLFIPFSIQDQININVSVGQKQLVVTTKRNDAEQVHVPLVINNQQYSLSTSEEDLKKGLRVQILGVEIHLKSSKEENTTMKTYAKNFLQWYFTLLQMKDAIKEGDMKRTNIILKHMVPFFYSHSTLSKYFTECIDYIIKTEHTLSPYMALKVRAASYVNMKGKQGKNKAADLQKENEVKYLKSLIRSLGSNKTEQSIINITKAGPVILDIANNFDTVTGMKKVSTTQKTKSRERDIQVITGQLQQDQLWNNCQRKILIGKTPFEFDRAVFTRDVMSNVERLLMDLPMIEENDVQD